MYRSVFLSGLGIFAFFTKEKITLTPCSVILLYDYSLNLGSEATIIWSSPMRPSKCWFFAVRYFPIACNAAIVLFYFGHLTPEASQPRCINDEPDQVPQKYTYRRPPSA
jgi:hypothetical protein